AAQRLNLQSSRKKKKHHTLDKSAYTALYRRNFSDVLLATPPPLPPGYLKISSRRESPGLGKVKVMLRISNAGGAASCLTVDSRKKQVAVYDSSAHSTQSATSSSATKQAGVNAPKMFAFDAVFTPENSQTEVCTTTLMDVLHAVVSGTDGCVFSYGYPGLGKTTTMLGQTEGSQEIGVIPCAISWLFQLISDQKDKSGSRFSVRVSAVEVAGKEQTMKDLLATFASGSEGGGTSPGMFLQDEILLGAQLANICELRAPTIQKALFFLDAALKARNVPVAGGRSRLYFFDFGSCEKQVKSREVATRQPLSLSGLGSVLLALFNGQKHVPY
ncbi:kinesin-like protein KIF26A, partial [Limulus polyphemus]|uniref:Kinesin-like protein KIF26A n=1 Tax=Limulus polyphemus TaxID=6850 RepID=A0ABM1TLX0_LIMPO